MRHGMDWELVGEDRVNDLMPVVCLCGWRSHVKFTASSGSWWAVWARHLEAELHRLSAKMMVETRR